MILVIPIIFVSRQAVHCTKAPKVLNADYIMFKTFNGSELITNAEIVFFCTLVIGYERNPCIY